MASNILLESVLMEVDPTLDNDERRLCLERATLRPCVSEVINALRSPTNLCAVLSSQRLKLAASPIASLAFERFLRNMECAAERDGFSLLDELIVTHR